MNHSRVNERNHEIGRLVAQKLQEEPSLIEPVVQRLRRLLGRNDRSASLKRNYQEWLNVIEKGPEDVIHILTGIGEENDRLRQSMPFGILLSPKERLAILSKYESFRTGVRTPGLDGRHQRQILHRLGKPVDLGALS